jgi:hypothetical protein
MKLAVVVPQILPGGGLASPSRHVFLSELKIATRDQLHSVTTIEAQRGADASNPDGKVLQSGQKQGKACPGVSNAMMSQWSGFELRWP